MPVSHHKHLVQNGPVVDEALQHAGRTHVVQAAHAEDQGHLHGHHAGQAVRGRARRQPGRRRSRLTSWESEPWATLVLQTGEERGKERELRAENALVQVSSITTTVQSVKTSVLKQPSDFSTQEECEYTSVHKQPLYFPQL